jgi:hypothetical protein
MTKSWLLYDYVDGNGRNVFKDFTLCLETKELAKLNRKLEMLEKEPELPPGLLVGPLKGFPHLYLLKIKGDVQVRPFLCKGPAHRNREFTLLFGAYEKDSKYIPPNAWELAEANRLKVEADPIKRRCRHERIGKKPKTGVC